MRVWFIRHGESETNKTGHYTGWFDAPLTEKGRSDALLARSALKEVNFDKIYSSDLARARTTAEIAVPGCEYESTSLIREINVGNLSGKPSSSLDDVQKKSAVLEGYKIFDGESVSEFTSRVSEFMKLLENSNYQNVAVFSHAGVIRKVLDIVLGSIHPRKNVMCHNCTIAVFDYTDSVWKLHSWINLS